MYKELKKKIENEKDYLKVKYEIIDNLDNLDNKQKKEIYKTYKKQYGKVELWYLLRSIYGITYKKQQGRVVSIFNY